MEPLRLKMAAQRAACERQIAAGRDRVASASAACRAAALSARPGYHQTLSHQEELTGLKGRLRELEDDLAQSLSIKLAKESKCELARESISSTAAMSEQLKNLVTDQRNRRDQHATVILLRGHRSFISVVSAGLLESKRAYIVYMTLMYFMYCTALEALEVKNNQDETWRKGIEKAVFWYQKFLGFQVVVGGEGVKFVFDKVDLQNPEKEYSFPLKFDKR